MLAQFGAVVLATLGLAVPFQITVDTVVAVEGGPVVLDVFVSYRGKCNLYYPATSKDHLIWIEPPKEWFPRRNAGKGKISFRLGRTVLAINTDSVIATRVFVHENYDLSVSSGKATLTVKVAIPLCTSNCNERVGSIECELPVTIVVQPCTVASTERVFGAVEGETIQSNANTATDYQRYLEFQRASRYVVGTTRSEFGLIAVHLLRHRPCIDLQPAQDVVLVALRRQASSPDVRSAMLHHLHSSQPYNACLLLHAWAEADRRYALTSPQSWNRSFRYKAMPDKKLERLENLLKSQTYEYQLDAVLCREHRLTDCELMSLANCQNPLIKVLVYLYLGNRLNSRWEAECLEDLRRYVEQRNVDRGRKNFRNLTAPKPMNLDDDTTDIMLGRQRDLWIYLEDELLHVAATLESPRHRKVIQLLSTARLDTEFQRRLTESLSFPDRLWFLGP